MTSFVGKVLFLPPQEGGRIEGAPTGPTYAPTEVPAHADGGATLFSVLLEFHVPPLLGEWSPTRVQALVAGAPGSEALKPKAELLVLEGRRRVAHLIVERPVGQSDRTPVEDVLVDGLRDWVYPAWAYMSAELSGETDGTRLRDYTIRLIADLLRHRLVVAGDIVNRKHVPWDVTPDEAAERISREWREEWGDEFPTPGAIVWLENTPAGDEIARAVLAREGK